MNRIASLVSSCAMIFSGIISGCAPFDTSDYKYRGIVAPSNVVNINVDTTLSNQNISDTAYVVDGVTLTLDNTTIDASDGNGYSFNGVTLLNGARLVGNGTIINAGIGTVIQSDLPANYDATLDAMQQANRLAYIAGIKAGIAGGSVIDGIKYINNKIGIYVTRLGHNNEILNVDISRGRLGIYLDSNSSENHIQYSTIHSMGKHYLIKKLGLWFPYAREAIAVDNSSNNVIEDNNFVNLINGGIYLYKNCGEANGQGGIATPREGGSNNNTIRCNNFDTMSKIYPYDSHAPAIWVSSRFTDRHTYPCRADDQGDIVNGTVIHDNIFNSVYEEVLHEDG